MLSVNPGMEILTATLWNLEFQFGIYAFQLGMCFDSEEYNQVNKPKWLNFG
jgi:hypothetical protein